MPIGSRSAPGPIKAAGPWLAISYFDPRHGGSGSWASVQDADEPVRQSPVYVVMFDSVSHTHRGLVVPGRPATRRNDLLVAIRALL
jgi:hypothetical protein